MDVARAPMGYRREGPAGYGARAWLRSLSLTLSLKGEGTVRSA
ncbi:hypothetical protein Pssp01_51620 [Pseudomonas sp. NBRC 100443]|nr:hypothetical protein Pssp01_51620 [Pseudomonas sp. NBRC 100443]